MTHIEKCIDSISDIISLSSDPIRNITSWNTTPSFKKPQFSLQNLVENMDPDIILRIQGRIPEKRLLPVNGHKPC